jgi:hypothetical protein
MGRYRSIVLYWEMHFIYELMQLMRHYSELGYKLSILTSESR